MQIINTIIPIFAVILMGMFARKKGYIPDEFLGPANKLVFYLAIPAMIFKALCKASLKTQFSAAVLIISICCVLTVFVIGIIAAWVMGTPKTSRGTFVQNSMHGNLGYVGLAVAFYYLGDQGLVKASIITGFLMIIQNILSVLILQINSGSSPSDTHKIHTVISKIGGNPIVVSAIFGIVFSVFDIPLPVIVDRSLKILSSMALPTALLIIGASLSFELIQINFKKVLACGMLKLILLPGMGLILFTLYHISSSDYTAALILLSSPTATVSYVMAKEMNGDPDLAVAGISSSTLFSAVTFVAWLHLAA